MNLIELSNSVINKINKELEENEDNILHNKYFVYPVKSDHNSNNFHNHSNTDNHMHF